MEKYDLKSECSCVSRCLPDVQPNITSSVLHIVRHIVVFILLALYYKLNKSLLPPSEAAYISSIATHFIYCFTHVRRTHFMTMLTGFLSPDVHTASCKRRSAESEYGVGVRSQKLMFKNIIIRLFWSLPPK